MDKKEILKAKVDYWKTLVTISIGATLTSGVLYWTISNKLGKLCYMVTTFCFAIAFFMSVKGYDYRHRTLIDELCK